jgi:hypothetical protein
MYNNIHELHAKIWETSEKLAYILMFLSPLLNIPIPFIKQTCCTMILKKRCHQQIWNKILNIRPCIGQISGMKKKDKRKVKIRK